MSYVTNSVGDAMSQLAEALTRRSIAQPIPGEIEMIRTPVALMFVRGDRAEPGATLAKQVVHSFGYWNFQSAEYLDLVFFGWFKDGDTVGFQEIKKTASAGAPPEEAGIFIDCCREIERMSKWRYSGETDVLLVDFEMPTNQLRAGMPTGALSFKNCIYLPVEEMIAEKRTRSLDVLVQELVSAAREVYEANPQQGTVFDMSDRIAWTRGRNAVWDALKRTFLRDWGRVYDELRPFAVCNLSV
jgi:hypothetical protein